MNVLGIVNFEDDSVKIDGLGDYRPVPAVSFMGRYRIIDVILSNMTNSGIDNVQVYCKEKPRNLFDHLGDGGMYNINSKRGKMRILYGEKPFSSPVYNTDVANFLLNLQYIEEDTNPYVLVAPSYFVYNFDFNEAFKAHTESGADITALYTSTNDAKTRFLSCDVITMDKEKRITAFEKNRGKSKSRQVSMEAYILSKALFIQLIKQAANISSLYWFKDILHDQVEELVIKGYGVRGYVSCIDSLSEYYRTGMELKNPNNAELLFKEDRPIYTQTNDSSPTRYTSDADVKDSVIANGCLIEGTVEGSIIGRNVTIKEGAVVKNSIIMTDAVIDKDAKLEYVVVDKYAIVHHIKKLVGTETAPVYVKRRDRI